jgi:hypothetical protein
MLGEKLKKAQEAIKAKFKKKSQGDIALEKILASKPEKKNKSFDSKKDVGEQLWDYLNIN